MGDGHAPPIELFDDALGRRRRRVTMAIHPSRSIPQRQRGAEHGDAEGSAHSGMAVSLRRRADASLLLRQ